MANNKTAATTPKLPEGMRFEAPPRAMRGRKSYVWEAKLTPVVENPGQWIMVRDDFKNATAVSRVATNLKKGRLTTPEGEGTWDFAARTLETENGSASIFALYARFTPTQA